MNNVNNQISRMKAMMTYGLQTESKNNSYSGVEYQREGADGKMYGIVREGTKYYIKVSNKKNNVLKEDYNYIGGFRNRKDHEYTSYANALKNFEMKMSSINESVGKREPLIESWNPEKKETLAVEATDRMRREIARQREIMGNAVMIQEKKNYSVVMEGENCCKVNKECAATQKNNIKKVSDGIGEPTGNGGDPFTKKVSADHKATQKTNVKKEYKPVTEGEQVLGWNENEDYLDTTHGTEVGDSAPFTENPHSEKEMQNGTVEESVAMHNTDNQNSPAVGVGEVGDDAPFTEKADNELQEGFFHNDDLADDEQLEDTPDEIQLEDEDLDDAEPMDDEMGDAEFDDEEMDDEDFGGEDFEDDMDDAEPMDGEMDDTEFDDEEMDDAEFADEEMDDEDFSDDTESRLDAIEDMLSKIAEKLGVDLFDDDSLYDDEEGEEENEEEDEEDFEIYESVAYRQLMKEESMDYFGKHPAYQKEPMKVPSNKHSEMQDYYDMNDDSVYSEQPYGQGIGSGAPFEVDPEEITNAIAESIKKILKKKI